jgi:hypothetical protein
VSKVQISVPNKSLAPSINRFKALIAPFAPAMKAFIIVFFRVSRRPQDASTVAFTIQTIQVQTSLITLKGTCIISEIKVTAVLIIHTTVCTQRVKT